MDVEFINIVEAKIGVDIINTRIEEKGYFGICGRRGISDRIRIFSIYRLLGVMEEIRSFPFSRLMSTKIAKATLASQAPNARINIGMVKYMVDLEDKVKEIMRVRERIDASRDRRHISNLLRKIIIDEIVIIEIISVSS